MLSNRIQKIYRRIGYITCSSVFLLFLLGGLVRATGSGMGCPDWPRCFGLVAPPTCDCDLPANYQQVFLEKRIKKVERFSSFLEKVGMTKQAERLRTDPSIRVPEKFNLTKAWIEYINRVFGVLSGIFSLAWFLWVWIKKDLSKYRLWVTLGFIFLVINAWFGSIVVATNLVPGIVSLHFLLSFICLFAFIYALHKQSAFRWINNSDEDIKPLGVWIIWATIWLIVTLGTWAREETEMLRTVGRLVATGDNILDLQEMGFSFMVHRFLPAAIWLFAAYFLRKQSNIEGIHFGSPWFWIFVVSTLQICLGAVQIVYVLPMWSQTLHIVFGSALLTLSFIWALSEQHAQNANN